MAARFRSWWGKIKQHPYVTGLVVILVLILFILSAYKFGWYWTGFNSGTNQITITSTSKVNYTATVSQPSKSLWDWLGLLAVLAIPVVVGFGAAWFTAQQGKVSDRENTDNQREAALQGYIDKMSELLLDKHLRKLPMDDDEVRKIARVRTLTVLRRCDGERKASVLQFLYESELINKDKPIINLEKADLSKADLIVTDLAGADLSKVQLFKANLNSANLNSANLREANLTKAILFRANLCEASLHGASLLDADLRGANLNGADLSEADLSEADLTGGFDTGPTGDWRNDIVWSVTDLSEADLTKAHLNEADLSEAKLIGATLRGAILRSATLLDADLSGADLSGADLTGAAYTDELDKAKSLTGATMPDGTKHD